MIRRIFFRFSQIFHRFFTDFFDQGDKGQWSDDRCLKYSLIKTCKNIQNMQKKFFDRFWEVQPLILSLIRWSLPEILPDQNMQKHPKKIFWPFLGSIGGCMYLSLSLATETSYRSLDHPERFQPRPPRLVKIFTKNKRRSVTPFDVTIYQKQFSVTLRSLCAYGANISLSSYWSHYL